MPALPKLTSRSVSNLQLPKLGSPPSYASFLKTLTGIKANSKSLAVVEKSEIDAEYNKLLRQRFKHDDISIRKYMGEASSKVAKEQWQATQDHIQNRFGGITTVSESVKQLKLPAVGNSIKGASHTRKSHSVWDFQKYEMFAVNCERLNPNVRFDKTLMDNAFRYAVSLVIRWTQKGGRRAVAETNIIKCIDRCTGAESEKYWKDR